MAVYLDPEKLARLESVRLPNCCQYRSETLSRPYPCRQYIQQFQQGSRTRNFMIASITCFVSARDAHTQFVRIACRSELYLRGEFTSTKKF